MPLDVTCPHCSAHFETPDSFAGKLGKCPMCGEAFRAPQASVSSASLPKATPLPRAKPLPEEVAVGQAPAPSSAKPARQPEPAAQVQPVEADESPGFQPIVTTAPTSGSPIVATPAAPSGGFARPAPGAPASPSGSLRPPTTGVVIPTWAWMVGGVVLVAVLGLGVWAINALAGRVVATVPRKPGALDKEARGPALAIDLTKPRTVKTLEDATAAMVKIVSPTRRGTSLGSGFIVDRRGWIATNHHVIEGASANTRVHMADGTIYELEGVIADVPELDMAIVKFRNGPLQLTIFELLTTPDPKLGAEIYCYGHPRGVNFSVVNGVVGRVLPSRDLDEGGQSFVYNQMHSQPDMVWIQHSAPIQPGNSGGPLIDKATMKVIGVNTWVNEEVKFGYAGHVKYLQTLMQTTSETIKPYPPERANRPRFPWEQPEEEPAEPSPGVPQPGPGAPPPPVALVLPVRDITAQKITKQFEECEKLKWQPLTSVAYGRISELGKLLVTARELSLNEHLLPALDAETRQAAIESGEATLQKLGALDWSGDNPANMSRLAVYALEQPGAGIVAVARRLPGQSGRANLMLFDLEGTPVLAEMPESVAAKTKEGRMLIVGMATPIGAKIVLPNSGVVEIKVVRVNYTKYLGD